MTRTIQAEPSHADRSGLGQRKAAQIGETIGVLAQRGNGGVAAVTDLGRVTWLNQDVTGAGMPVITDNSKVNARLIAENERLQARVAELELAISKALFFMQSGQVKADLRGAYDNVR